MGSNPPTHFRLAMPLTGVSILFTAVTYKNPIYEIVFVMYRDVILDLYQHSLSNPLFSSSSSISSTLLVAILFFNQKKIMGIKLTDVASLRQDSLRQDSLKHHLGYRAPKMGA